VKVVVIGASNKPERYSYKAIAALKEARHDVWPVHPLLKEILGCPVVSSVTQVPGPIDTVTLYVNSAVSSRMLDEILAAKPRRIIFNPGAENDFLKKAAEERGIQTEYSCTLVMLSLGSF
jgi:uncharacterized protein